MNHKNHRKLKLSARNEGKIKSYESCEDVRAWSHDTGTRNYYLRDWIKCDTPICVIPVCTLSNILLIMTKKCEKTTYRCYSRCPSKVLLHRLCSSCTVMKDCLSNTRQFEKYFIEENLETAHWPCDKCLEILKSIKMFWKIVVEKVLKINLPRTDFKSTHICSIASIAQEWKKEMFEEALFVRSSSFLGNKYDLNHKDQSDYVNGLEVNKQHRFLNDRHDKSTKTDYEFQTIGTQTDGRYLLQKRSKCTTACIKMENVEFKPHVEKDNDVIMIYKNNIQNLQHQFNAQKKEVDRLKRENVELNVKLQRYRRQHSKNLYQCIPSMKTEDTTVALFPSGLNSKDESEVDKPKDIDSEMIITLKHCKNEDFRHISVIQVLHKTNEINLLGIDDANFKTEDPIDVLNKAHEKFAAIVNREISIACKTDGSFKDKNVVITSKSAYHNVGGSKSALSCSISSNSFMSESKFESANENMTMKSRRY